MSARLLHLPIRPLILALPLALGSLAHSPIGVTAEQIRNLTYDIPAGPLANQLNQFAAQAGIYLASDGSLTAGKSAPALRGSYGVEQALQRLLEASGLEAVRLDGNHFELRPAASQSGALQLSTTTVTGQGMGESTENSGSYTTDLTSVGSKTPTSIRQTPQAVSVVTDQVIQDRRMTDLADALKVTPGITVQNNNYRLSDFYSRGFKIENIQIDGAAPMALGTTAGSFYSNKNYNMVEFDHVEVLRGSSSLFGGTGDPGGMINLVRKRPLDVYQMKIDLSAGSWDNYRSQFDVTGPMGFDGKLRGRLIAAYTNRQYFMDDRGTEQPTLYAVIEADILPSTRLTFGGRSEEYHETGSGTGLPRYSTGADLGLPRHTSLTESWAYSDGHSQEVFAKLDHEFNDDWKANVSYTQTYDSGFVKSAFNFGSVDSSTGTGPAWSGNTNRWLSEQYLLDANVAGKFRFMGQEHELLFGADRQKITSRWRGTNQSLNTGGPIDVFDPDSTQWNEPPTRKDFFRDYDPNTQEQYGLYSTLRLHPLDQLHVIVGARAHRYKYHSTYRLLANDVWGLQSEINTREATKIVPYGGVVYDLTSEWSAYASYSEIYKPQQNQLAGPLPGSSLEPMTGKTYETGLKGELFDGAVNATIALYYTKREHQAVQDPNYPLTNILYGGNCCYVDNGEVVSKGLDLELTGEILPGWMVLSGYTYNNNRNRYNSAVLSSITPKHLFKFWSTYQLTGELHDFKVGGGVNIQSSNYVSGTATPLNGGASVPFDYTQAGYAIWNALAEYRIDDHWTLTYNLNNMFDKKYYSTVGSSASGNWYGEPRNHMLTLRGTFW
ncbi:TonB-dependent siderophore receptor [Pseudomonas sp. LRF_L74]|uniref:TonB-dependent siderophore receptor n=1 Tax=Pseudomonas sp. LRF_L74 TaxID=3369422 RepID=UPI003F5D8325